MRVLLALEARRQLDDLPLTMRRRVLGVIHRLEGWPEVSGVKWLRGEWAGHGRLRTGDYRVVFKSLGWSLLVVRILHRSEAYED